MRMMGRIPIVLRKVEALGSSWHYSRGARLSGSEPRGVEFVPMIWGYGGANDKFLGRNGNHDNNQPNKSLSPETRTRFAPHPFTTEQADAHCLSRS